MKKSNTTKNPAAKTNYSTDPKKYVGQRGPESLYKPEYCEAIIETMKDGSGLAAFSAKIGVGMHTPQAWAETNPDFKLAMAVAQAHCQAWWESAGKQGMLMGKQFNAAVYNAHMRNRFGWRSSDKTEIGTAVILKDDNDIKQLLELAAKNREKEIK